MPVQRLTTYDEFERQRNVFMDQMKKQDMECISCPKCGSQFFEQVCVNKFKIDHNIILTQDVPVSPAGAPAFRLLRCIRCNDILEPRVDHNSRDVLHGDYDKLLDTLEGKNDKRPKEQQVEKTNDFQIEKL